jgi:competence protein ComFC
MLLFKLAELIAPPLCLGCGNEGSMLCEVCRPSAIITKAPTCFVCNRISAGGRTCKKCRVKTVLAGASVASHYDGLPKKLIQSLKFERARSAAGPLAALITPLLSPGDFDIVTAVPPAPARYRERGFNHAELIARRVATDLGLPYRPLIARISNERQLGHSRRERLEQAKHSFLAWQSLNYERILIIDDVLTTGATLSACASALKQAGAKRVWGAVAAKH